MIHVFVQQSPVGRSEPCSKSQPLFPRATLTALALVVSCSPVAAAPEPPRTCPPVPGIVAPDPPVFLSPKSDVYSVFSAFPDHENTLPALEDLGVGWIRVQLPMGEAEGEIKKAALRATLPELLTRGIGLWLTVYHRDPSNVADPEAFAASERGGFPPVDYGVYEDLVAETVCAMSSLIEAHALAPADWLVIQHGNEISLCGDQGNAPCPVDAFWHGSGTEYLEMLAHGYAAVKSVDPHIPVAAAGIASGMLEAIVADPVAVPDPAAVPAPGPDPADLLAWMDELLTEGSYDWADVHVRHLIADVPEKIDWVRDRAHGRLAATEVAGPDPRVVDLPEELEVLDEWQAADLPVRLQVLRATGVERVFWAGLVENEFSGPVHQFEGLIRLFSIDDWYRKPAFAAYETLIDDALGPEPCPSGLAAPIGGCL